MRIRKLLMHKKEIARLFGQVKQQGYSLIPRKTGRYAQAPGGLKTDIVP